MDTFLIRALQLMLSLSLLVLIHEGGHFLFARLFKIRVEKFCLFFDPWFTIFKFKPKKSDTTYALGWLPLGGYVKISGMIDESMDTEQMKQPAQPWEFRSKPAWQRLLVMVGGVMFNFFTALFIYSMILYAWGDQYIPLQEAPMGMKFNQTAKDIGFKDGDVLISADGVEFERYGEKALTQIVDARIVNVRRADKDVAVYIPEDMMQRLLADSVQFATFQIPYVLDSIMPNSPAQHAGLQRGDRVIALDGIPVSFYDFVEAMADRKSRSAKAYENDSVDLSQINLTYIRDGREHTIDMRVDSAFRIGVYTASMAQTMPLVQKEYGFFESFPAGIGLGVDKLTNYISNMKYVFSKEGAKQIGGFGTIASIFPATWDWHSFWYMTAFLSIILAFMNILPIPALDGGHVLFLLYEIIARRKPSDKFMEYSQMVGMVLLFGLLIWANFNDVIRYIF